GALRVATSNGAATVTREDSALWRVVAPGGEALVRYRIHLPPAESPRAAWRPFLTATGGLVGGPHSFMYVVGATLAPSHVTLELPPEWEIATGLEPTLDPRTFFAPSVGVLVDSPLLVGRLRGWRFAVDGVPHRVVYWPLPDAAPFDTTALAGNIERLARQAVAVRARAVSRLFVSPAGWCLRRARTPQLGHARRAERGPRSRSRGAARRGRARVLPHLEPDAHPSGGIRRRELPNAAAGARVMVERGAHDALRRSATPARRTARVRLHPR